MSKELLKKIEELEERNKMLMDDIIIDRDIMRELLDFEMLKTEVHPLIERLWAIDSGAPYGDDLRKEKEEIITTIAYTIAREWID